MRCLRWPWAGVFGGAAFWYAAHDLATYLSAFNCRHGWVAASIHLIALLGAMGCGILSYQTLPGSGSDGSERRRLTFSGGIGMAAAALFSLVILWQGIATLIYSGCER
ncbi:MAG: hypothetical protein PHG00_00275 [Methylococcales bacterium]|nr:hypothetical protein [Methylococcales bacterium]